MATDRELLVDALARVRIALQTPGLTDNERSILIADCVNGFDEDDVRASLVMTQREFRKTKSDALDKASVITKKPVAKAALELKESDVSTNA